MHDRTSNRVCMQMTAYISYFSGGFRSIMLTKRRKQNDRQYWLVSLPFKNKTFDAQKYYENNKWGNMRWSRNVFTYNPNMDSYSHSARLLVPCTVVAIVNEEISHKYIAGYRMAHSAIHHVDGGYERDDLQCTMRSRKLRVNIAGGVKNSLVYRSKLMDNWTLSCCYWLSWHSFSFCCILTTKDVQGL